MKPTETAWLVELRGHGVPLYLHLQNHHFGYTADVNLALKLADKESAEQLAALQRIISMHSEIVVADHLWCSLLTVPEQICEQLRAGEDKEPMECYGLIRAARFLGLTPWKLAAILAKATDCEASSQS